MKKEIDILFEYIFTKGAYTKPFVLGFLNSDKHQFYHLYFNLLIKNWGRNFTEIIKDIDICLDKYKNEVYLYYNLLTEKNRFLQMYENAEEANEVYEAIKKDFSKIPPKYRYHIILGILNHVPLSDFTVSTFRLWGKEYTMNREVYVFYLRTKFNYELAKNNLNLSIRYLVKMYRAAKECLHITGIIDPLNNLSWYLNESHHYLAYLMTDKMMFESLYYREELDSEFFLLDTAFEVYNTDKSFILFKFAECMNYYSEKITDELKLKKYSERIRFCRKYEFDHSVSTYDITEEIIAFINSKIDNISNAAEKTGLSRKAISSILNFRTKRIDSDTIQKLIKNIDYEITKESPFPFINEKMKIDMEAAFDKVSFKPEIITKKHFIAAYSSLFGKNKKYKTISENLGYYMTLYVEDNDKFIEEMGRLYEGMRLVLELAGGYTSYIDGRKKLINEFFDDISESDNFIEKYISLSDKDKEFLDKFMRNYVRYNREHPVQVEPIKRMAGFIKNYGLKEQPAYLSYWCMEEKEQKKLLSIIKEKM